MPLRDTWIAAARGEKAGISGRLLTGSMIPLEMLYRGGLACYLGMQKAGLRKRASLPARVVSVGNLTLGGTGKTSVVELLGGRLKDHRRTAVLLRGYGAEVPEAGVVVSDGRRVLADWRQAGDEAVLLAKSLPGVTVIVGKDRRITGRKAVDDFGAEIIVLDDGLQYWQLERDLDIVLVDARAPFGNGRVMPAGMLREPATGLGRAGAVIVTHANEVHSGARNRLAGMVMRLAPSASLHFAHYQASGLYSPGCPQQAADRLRHVRVMALCAIGSPESFAATLEDAGATVGASLYYPDHHPYTQKDIEKTCRWADEAGCKWIVTTEKDLVRMEGLRPPESLKVLRAEIVISALDRLVDLVDPGLAGGGGG